jgi:hypothetical protein
MGENRGSTFVSSLNIIDISCCPGAEVLLNLAFLVIKKSSRSMDVINVHGTDEKTKQRGNHYWVPGRQQMRMDINSPFSRHNH